MAKDVVNLTGVPETMLWTLHNRACEAKRPGGLLHDPTCVEIYDAIDYDFSKSFGRPDGSHAMRSQMFDAVMKPWLAAHPGGTVVELAAGLETQFHRINDGKVRWICVDVEEAIAVRERFLPESERCTYLRKSALDLTWLEEVDADKGVFISAQGLFMYFQEEEVKALLIAIFHHLPNVELMFDTIPDWFSKKTLRGFQKTRHYRSPPMPWGLGQDELGPLLRSWSPRVHLVTTQTYGILREPALSLLRLASKVNALRKFTPAIAHVTTRRWVA